MSNKANVLVSVAAFLLAMFIPWYGGIDIFSRGFYQAYFFYISVCIGLGCYFFMRSRR